MGGITQAINVVKKDFSQKLYFKEDIERLIVKLRECIKNNATDTEQTVRSKIIRMFASYGIELERTLTPKQYYEQLELHAILSVKDFPRLCWTEMSKVNMVYKTPKEYMERLVNELVSPEYNLPESPIRVKILKQILGKLDCLRGTSFQSKKLISIIENDYDGLIGNIDDEIFKNYLTPIQPCKYLRVLLDVYGDILYRDGEKDDDLASLVSVYNNSVKDKTAKQLLRFIRANNPEVKTDGNGKEIDAFNIADFDKSLVEQIKSYLDGVRIAFKGKYDEDLKNIELLEQQIHIQQFPVVMQFVYEHKLCEQLKTKRFVALVKSHLGIDVEENSVDCSLIETIMNYSLSAESKEKFNNYLIKQITKFFEKADDKSKNEYSSFVVILNKIETTCNQVQYDAIECFIRTRGLYEQLFTSEIINIVASQQENNLEAVFSHLELTNLLTLIRNENPETLKKLIPLLIKRIKEFRMETNQSFAKGLDNVSDRASIPEILKISNDLAEGKYKKGSKMKEILYLFAFAFDMSVSFADGKEKTLRDIKKNLFEDFYCDNIIRYVNDFQLNGEYDEPTGITIQFKNFVEIVYLYWLNKDSKAYSPAEKYLSANAMIKKIVSKIKSAEKEIDKSTTKTGKKYFEAKILADKKSLGTEVYRNFIRTDSKDNGNRHLKIDSFLSLSEDDFLGIILENYDVDTTLKYTTSAAFENEDYQETAESNFGKLIDQLKKETDGLGFVPNCYSLEFYETVFEELFAKKEYDAYLHMQLSTLVKKINEQMKQVLSEAEVEGYNIFTRTRYMYLYYNHFILRYIGEDYIETFDDFYDEYCENLNKNLEDCSYQLFSEKNLIDIMLLYSAFITLRTEDN